MKDLDGTGEEKNATAPKSKAGLADVARKLEEEKIQEETKEETLTPDKKKVKKAEAEEEAK
jgi:hypothetical protein